MSSYEEGMTELVNENKGLKAKLLATTNQLKALKRIIWRTWTILQTRLLENLRYSKDF